MINKTTYIIFLLFLESTSIAASPIEYHSEHDKTSQEVSSYNQIGNTLERYLSFRDIPVFLKKYVQASKVKALDFGSGTGISTEFLVRQRYDVTAVDISQEMIKQFKINHPTVPCFLIEENKLPEEHVFDIVFSSFVILELPRKDAIKEYFETAQRALKNDGIFIIVTTSEMLYPSNVHEWFLFRTSYPENQHLKSGDLATVYQYEGNIKFTDYFWTEQDISDLLKQTGFEILEIHYPLGLSDESYPWKDEKHCSPFVIFIAKNKIG